MFTSKYGTDFWIYSKRGMSAENNVGMYYSDIYIDVDGAGNGNDCQYSVTDCIEPDRFKLSVKASGEVIPTDAMSVYYLRTRTNYRLNTVRQIANFVSDMTQFLFPININCGSGRELVNGECSDKCTNGLVRQADGTCAEPVTECGDNEELVDSACLTKCADSEERVDGECLEKCPDGYVRIGKTCQPPEIEPPLTPCSETLTCPKCGQTYTPSSHPKGGFCEVTGTFAHKGCDDTVQP